MEDEFTAARDRARRTIEGKWLEVARNRTLGWGGPIEAIEGKFPFVRSSLVDLGGRIPDHMPIFIFQSRESPPNEMEFAVPYRDRSGNPYNCRVVASVEQPSSETHISLLSDFAQALWFALDQGMLPPPRAGNALQEALLVMTGEALFTI